MSLSLWVPVYGSNVSPDFLYFCIYFHDPEAESNPVLMEGRERETSSFCTFPLISITSARIPNNRDWQGKVMKVHRYGAFNWHSASFLYVSGLLSLTGLYIIPACRTFIPASSLKVSTTALSWTVSYEWHYGLSDKKDFQDRKSIFFMYFVPQFCLPGTYIPTAFWCFFKENLFQPVFSCILFWVKIWVWNKVLQRSISAFSPSQMTKRSTKSESVLGGYEITVPPAIDEWPFPLFLSSLFKVFPKDPQLSMLVKESSYWRVKSYNIKFMKRCFRLHAHEVISSCLSIPPISGAGAKTLSQ